MPLTLLPTQVVVFNRNSTLLDAPVAIDGIVAPSAGAASGGYPVVLNPNGVIDPSLMNVGANSTAGEASVIPAGSLVSFYESGGTLHIELAWAGTTLSPPSFSPSGAPYPLPAQGFIATAAAPGSSVIVQFSGLYNYVDRYAEFSSANVGQEVYLDVRNNNLGGITLTLPSGAGQLVQTVGTVAAYTAGTSTVTVIFQASFNNFSSISGIVAIGQGGTGATTGAQALINLIAGSPALGEALTWNGSAWVPQASSGGPPGGSVTNLQYRSGASTFGGIPGSSVETTGAVALAPTGFGSGNAALTITGDTPGGNDIFALIVSAGAGGPDVLWPVAFRVQTTGNVIIAPGKSNSQPSLAVIGDSSGSDIQGWFVNAGGSPVALIDLAGNLKLPLAGIKDNTGTLGTNRQVLSSTSTKTLWTDAELTANYRSIRDSSPGTVTAGTLGGPYTINFSPAFADGNYTVEVTAVIGETLYGGGPCFIAGVQQQVTPGNGINVWVSNNDTNNHTVTINIIARHD